MKHIINAAILFTIVGCVSSKSRRQADYEHNRNQLAMEFTAEMYVPDCTLNTREIFKPRKCPPLISKENESAENNLIKSCHSKGATKKCLDKINDFVSKETAQMLLRYKYANMRKVNLECKAAPESCLSSLAYELKMMDSHNNILSTAMLEAVRQYDRDYADSLLVSHRHQELLRAVSQPPQSSQANCITNVIGNQIYTQCY